MERKPLIIATIALDQEGDRLTYQANVPLLGLIGLLQHTLALVEADWKAQQEQEQHERAA